MNIRYLNWGFIDFVFQVCIVIVGLLWLCAYESPMLGTLFIWLIVGLIIFLVLITVSLAVTRATWAYLHARDVARAEKHHNIDAMGERSVYDTYNYK